QARAPPLHLVFGAYHVAHRYTFRNADNQVQIRFHRLVYRRRGERWRHVDHRHRSSGFFFRLAHRREDRNALIRFTGFFWVYASDIAVLAVSVLLAHLRMELPGLAGDTLRHHTGVLIDEYRHFIFLALL